MRLPALTALAAVCLLAGCGDDPPGRDLRSDRLVVLDWGRADPRSLCETEQAARTAPGRTALRTSGTRAGQDCWIAVTADDPVATGRDVTAVRQTGDREELRFATAAQSRIEALGTDAHVGVVYDDRLLDVVFPQAGRVRIPADG